MPTETRRTGGLGAIAHAGRPTSGHCRFCGTRLEHVVTDLGMSPLCESFLPAEAIHGMEPFYPLVVFVCDRCYLVQLEEFVSGEEIFRDYAYFSSYSDSWLAHCERYTDEMISRLGLDEDALVVELASNDGYLLQYFKSRAIPCLGIEPARNVAAVAEEKGIPTITEFFGVELATQLAAEGRRADLLAGNNVLAQVHDLNDFVAGMKILLAEGGTLTIEFPHLVRLVEENQFDTVYHEHFSYFSFTSAAAIFAAHGLELFDVEELPTHGGSLRIYGAHAEEGRSRSERAEELLRRERELGVDTLTYYASFDEQVKETKRKLLEFLIRARREGKTVVGYGAPGKGNTLLNYCGIRTDFLDYTVDRNPHKLGKYLPGTHIPIHPVDRIFETRPDFVLILPWNLREEISDQMAGIRAWGGRFVVPIPEVTILP